MITAPYAVKMLLLNQVELALKLYINKLALAEICGNYNVDVKIANIPIKRIPCNNGVIYESAIALKLASQYNLPPLEIATQLATFLETTTDNNSNASKLYFCIEVASNGWIYFYLNNSSLAVWLQHLIEISAPLFDCFNIAETQNIELKRSFSSFPIQYTHARCCSLLRLGEQEGLIKISRNNYQGKFSILEPNPIPWLNSVLSVKVFGNPTPDLPANEEKAKRILPYPVSREAPFCSLHLIEQLLDLLDELSITKLIPPQKATSRLLKLTQSLSEAMINFDRTCRILPEVKTHPQLAQGRLGLVAVTQSLLQFMLVDRFNINAPEEL